MDGSCASQGDPHSAPDRDFPSQSLGSIRRLSNPLALLRATTPVLSSARPASGRRSVELLDYSDFLVSGLSIPFDKEAIELEGCLQTSADTGLTDAEARSRLALWGQNIMKGQRRYTGLGVLWKQVSNAMTVILVGCLIIAFATRDYSEGGVIAGTAASIFG